MIFDNAREGLRDARAACCPRGRWCVKKRRRKRGRGRPAAQASLEPWARTAAAFLEEEGAGWGALKKSEKIIWSSEKGSMVDA